MPNEITKQTGSTPSLQSSDILQPAPPDSRQDNETWKRLRQTVVDRLRQFPAFIEVIRSRSSDICRIKLPRETWAALEQGKAGWKYDSAAGAFFPTVLGEKGEFLKQARLEPLAGDLANSLANLAVAQGIARIENELRDLRVEIQAIRQGQVDDRRGLLQAGIHRYEQALVSSDLDLRKKGLLTAIQSLTEARGQLLASAETHIKDASRLPTKGFPLWIETAVLGRDINGMAGRALDGAGEDLQNAFEATRYIVYAHSELGEKQAAMTAARQLADWWQRHAATARSPARLILARANTPLPEKVWSSEAVDSIVTRIKELENDGAVEVEFEVERRELLND